MKLGSKLISQSSLSKSAFHTKTPNNTIMKKFKINKSMNTLLIAADKEMKKKNMFSKL